MLDLTAPAINQLKGEDAKDLVSFYMNTEGLVKAHEWSADNAAEINIAPPQPNALSTSAPTANAQASVATKTVAPSPAMGGGQRRIPKTVAEVTQNSEEGSER